MFSLGIGPTGFGHLWSRHVILIFHVIFISVLGSEHLESICKLSFSTFPFCSSRFFFFPQWSSRCSRGGYCTAGLGWQFPLSGIWGPSLRPSSLSVSYSLGLQGPGKGGWNLFHLAVWTAPRSRGWWGNWSMPASCWQGSGKSPREREGPGGRVNQSLASTRDWGDGGVRVTQLGLKVMWISHSQTSACGLGLHRGKFFFAQILAYLAFVLKCPWTYSCSVVLCLDKHQPKWSGT